MTNEIPEDFKQLYDSITLPTTTDDEFQIALKVYRHCEGKIAELRAEIERKQKLLDDARAVMERQIARRKELEDQDEYAVPPAPPEGKPVGPPNETFGLRFEKLSGECCCPERRWSIVIELTDTERSFISQRLLSRARHQMKKLNNGRDKPLHPTLIKQMQDDVRECIRLAEHISPDATPSSEGDTK